LKDSYLLAGIRFRPLIRLISRNHISWTPKNITRVVFLLQSAYWSSLFSRIELTNHGDAIDKTSIPHDPVFIVGHWRTGSTLLHQLMAQDPGLSAPTLFQVALPDNFLVAYRFYQPIFRLMGSSRPMDNVRIGMNEPQEDEYAVFRLTTSSPLERLIFPEKKGYFLNQASFLPEGKLLDDWKKGLTHFYRKIYYATGKRIISKNPFNSMRIPLLVKLFPEAKFIHIVRHPYAVVPSTQYLWNVVHKQNTLNNNSYIPDLEDISTFFAQLSQTVENDLSFLPEESVCRIRYEDLEQNPVESLRSVYQKLKLPFTENYEVALRSFLGSISGYKKNKFNISDAEKETIANIMKDLMRLFDYRENV